MWLFFITEHLQTNQDKIEIESYKVNKNIWRYKLIKYSSTLHSIYQLTACELLTIVVCGKHIIFENITNNIILPMGMLICVPFEKIPR